MKMNRTRGLLLVLLAVPMYAVIATLQAGSAQAAAAQAATPALPDGPGKGAFQTICSGCHLLTVVTSQRKSADDWGGVVDDMRGRGAQGSDDDFNAIIKYLGDNFAPAAGHINVNTADAASIASATSITKTEADAIVSYREKNGKFKDIASLKTVPGVDAAHIDAAKDHIDF